MKRPLLSLALIAVAGTAAAQTVQTKLGAVNSDTRINTQLGGGGVSPEIANAPSLLSAAAATARKRIEMDGYRDVQGLAKGPDGLWQGTAMRGNTSAQVTVDRSGNVSAK